MIVVSILVWFLLIRISNDYQVKTDLLLSRQREEMYRESVISSGEQIRQMSEIKHDMKNDFKSIYRLIENNQYMFILLMQIYPELFTPVPDNRLNTGKPLIKMKNGLSPKR